MKKCLFTPEQKEVVIDNAYEFGKFFAKKQFIKAWTPSFRNEFKKNLNKVVKNQSRQLGILFAYHISIKNFDYFIQNRSFDFERYFTSLPTTGWAGFTYWLFNEFQKLETNKEIIEFFEKLHEEIFFK